MTKDEFDLKSIFSFKACSGAERNCPNVILDGEELARKLKEVVVKNDLEDYLKEKGSGPILPHAKFKVGIAGCPNGCSRSQIRDLSLLARVKPEVIEVDCIGCGECVVACKEEAIELEDEIAVINYESCIDCGDCISSCPVDAIEEIKKGWSLAIGGKMGRHPQFATRLVDLMSTEEVITVFPELIRYYQKERQDKEKLGLVVNRVGEEEIKEELDL